MTTRPQDLSDDETADVTRRHGRERSTTNVSLGERLASAILGLALVFRSLRQRSLGGATMAFVGGWLLYRSASGYSYLYEQLGTDTATHGKRHRAGVSADATEVERTITVRKPADELSEFWRDSENLGRVVGHFVEVTETDEDRQRWAVHGPLGRTVAWDVRLVEDRTGELLRWESVEGAAVSSELSVGFRPAPNDRGTEVTLHLRLDPPGGALGEAAMGLLGFVPNTYASKVLYRSKSLVETGEIPTLERNPSARGSGDLI